MAVIEAIRGGETSRTLYPSDLLQRFEGLIPDEARGGIDPERARGGIVDISGSDPSRPGQAIMHGLTDPPYDSRTRRLLLGHIELAPEGSLLDAWRQPGTGLTRYFFSRQLSENAQQSDKVVIQVQTGDTTMHRELRIADRHELNPANPDDTEHYRQIERIINALEGNGDLPIETPLLETPLQKLRKFAVGAGRAMVRGAGATFIATPETALNGDGSPFYTSVPPSN